MVVVLLVKMSPNAIRPKKDILRDVSIIFGCHTVVFGSIIVLSLQNIKTCLAI